MCGDSVENKDGDKSQLSQLDLGPCTSPVLLLWTLSFALQQWFPVSSRHRLVCSRKDREVETWVHLHLVSDFWKVDRTPEVQGPQVKDLLKDDIIKHT